MKFTVKCSYTHYYNQGTQSYAYGEITVVVKAKTGKEAIKKALELSQRTVGTIAKIED